jgi:hypothetical protein
MDFPGNKDFSEIEQNRNNNSYLNYQETNQEFSPYQILNNPKIPMSYYFPEGNQTHNYRSENFFPQDREEREENYYQFHGNNKTKANINRHTDKLLENALKMVFL